MSSAKACKQCGADLALACLDAMRGEDAGVSVTIEGMPAYQCVQGHKRFLTADFPMRLIDSLAKGDTPDFPIARKKGLLKKRYHCPGCDGELPAGAERHASLARRLTLEDSTEFDASVAVPLYRCASCGGEAMHPTDEMTNALMNAAAQAFRSGGIPPG